MSTALASQIHTQAMALLQAAFTTRFRTYRLTPMLQVQQGDLPLLGVYLLRERHTPWGSANHAEPKFEVELTLGVSGGVHVETDKQDQISALEAWMGEALTILLSNSKFVRLAGGIPTIDRQGQYAKVGEVTLYEIRLEMTLIYQDYYPPIVTDDFDVLSVQTQFPDKAHVDSGTPQLDRVYDINENS